MPVRMSFLGVGAPEALLVAVVALVVFGPKGLAEAARSLSQTVKAFAPAIRDVVDASQDLKGSLEKELGLDELRQVARPTPRPLSLDPVENKATSGLTAVTDEIAKQVDPEIEAKRAESAAAAWGSALPQTPAASAPAADLSVMSMEQLEAELARRKAAPAAAAADSTPAAQPKSPTDA